jgi:hypothetical protein
MPLTSSERSVKLAKSPQDALVALARAFGAAGFRNVRTDEGARMVTGEKRAFGQWTKGTLSAYVEPTDDGGATVTFGATAMPQSVTGLVSNPSARLINQIVARL